MTTERLTERNGDREYTIAENPAAQPVYPLNVRSFPGRRTAFTMIAASPARCSRANTL